jgi:hypothetical protein
VRPVRDGLQFEPHRPIRLTTGPASSETPAARSPSTPLLAHLSGADNVKWGIVPADITITQNVIFKSPMWNPANAGWDGITRDVKHLPWKLNTAHAGPLTEYLSARTSEIFVLAGDVVAVRATQNGRFVATG